MVLDLEGKTVLITGAAGGIGKAAVVAFHNAGAKVVASDLTAPALPDAAMAISHDVTSEDDWQDVVATIEARFGGLDILINNAGIALVADIEETSLDAWRTVMTVNLEGCFLGTREAIKAMKAQGGVIVNLSSIAGEIAAPILAAYSASKAGVAALGKVAAIHCTDKGYPIRVNTLKPGFTATAMVDSIGEKLGNPERVLAKLASGQPMGRLASAEEVAQALLFLASDQSSYMTGAELVLDGGFTAR